ncbi:MAG: hypothetical protein M0Q16_08260 [Candidatus Cloacimonetes bacterium]|nr:hypothetical protein [Candidatus Cloacimonadota bacterium]MCK9185351.1 hypothetical protein [Candidatus Cloacimonadota bacterium]
MTNLLFFLTAVAIPLGISAAIWLFWYMIYKLRKLQVYKGFYPHKVILGEELLTIEEIIFDIKDLYLHGIVKNLHVGEDYLSFEDNGCFWPWNIYYIKFSKLDELHYRGAFRIYQYNRRNLEAIRAFLSKVG